MLSALEAVAESVGPDDRVGVDFDAITQFDAVVQDRVGEDRDVVADFAVAADHHAWMDATTIAENGPFVDEGVWIDADVETELDAGMNIGERIDAARRRDRSPLQMLHDRDEGHQRILRADDRRIGMAEG